jgi:Undecaprenyl-phosphate glucose phosphotransferase
MQHPEKPYGRDRRARRSPALLELATFGTRVLEWAIATFVGLFSIWFTIDAFDLEPVQQYVEVAWGAGVVYAVVAEFVGCYDLDSRFSLRSGWSRVLGAWVGCCGVMLSLGFLTKVSGDFSRSWTIVWFVSIALALLIARGVSTAILLNLKRRGLFNQRIAIFGCRPQVDRLGRYLQDNSTLTVDLVGWYSSEGAESEYGDVSTANRGNFSNLQSDIRDGRIDQVIIAMPLPPSVDVEDTVGLLAKLPVLIRLAPDLSSFALASRSMVMLGTLPLMTLFERPINGMDQVAKAAEDYVIGLLMLIVFAPLMLIVAIAIRLDSPGPALFLQAREGFNHRPFRIMKFRTMYHGATQHDNIEQARIGDRRVTRIGRILRATSIDELPQLFNVLRGEMSLVGPRPHAPSTKVQGVIFSEATSDYASRHRVKPGITGWAQVNGWRGETDSGDKLFKRVEFDLFYIENWSISFDLYIMIRTVGAVLFSKAAY